MDGPFVERTAVVYGFDARRVVAVGFSNGANIAASLLPMHPETLHAAALLRPMVPFEPDPPPGLAGTAVLVAAGRSDPMVTAAETERLDALLRSRGADVELCWADVGHGPTQGEVEFIREWVSRRP